ncbi:MAG: histidinol-phosphate transaminase [Nitrososphaerota archaeon]|nr:histidinol-phosphate transaminase [Candidatus Bathyarchaeota archaeon]MDW8062316.1 histidinol-phosphate transaminase [Nitrososphaerota archaeon]
MFPLENIRIRKAILNMHGYETPRESKSVVKLDANENPYGPSPRVYEALIHSLKDLWRYPSREEYEKLEESIACKLGLDGDGCVVLGSGSDELIDLTIKLFIDPGNAILTVNPSFSMYKVYASIAGGHILEYTMTEDYVFDVEAFLSMLDMFRERIRLIALCNPNNPTGGCIEEKDIAKILGYGIPVLIDEAYIEFSRDKTAISMLKDYENLIVLRTFSKAYGLAGLRIGYAIASRWISDNLRKVRSPYSVNLLAVKAAEAAIQDDDHLRRVVEAIILERDKLFGRLSNISGLKPFPSKANFILVDGTKLGFNPEEFKSLLIQRGVSVRVWSKLGMRKGCLFRVSIGRPSDNDLFLNALMDIASGGWGS